MIELGKRLVAEVGIEGDDRDSLGRWLAHDIARKIHEAELLDGPEGDAAHDACTAAILRLWDHRAVFPRTQRPFAGVEGALNVLERLDLENAQNRYFPEPKRWNESDGWLATAMAIDRAARVLLRACARFAVEDEGKRASAFVELADRAGLHNDPDMAFVRIIMASGKDESSSDHVARRRAKELKALKVFTKNIKRIRAAIAAEEAGDQAADRSTGSRADDG